MSAGAGINIAALRGCCERLQSFVAAVKWKQSPAIISTSSQTESEQLLIYNKVMLAQNYHSHLSVSAFPQSNANCKIRSPTVSNPQTG